MHQLLLQIELSEEMLSILRVIQKFGVRLFLDLIAVFILVRFIYFPAYKHKELFFTFFIFNIVIFFICFLLNKVEMSLGAAFGLFAVFSMLRYRTEDISIKDMTYLFLVISIGLVTAVTKIKKTDDFHESLFIVFLLGIILFITWLLESNKLMKKESAKVILYENINLIKAGKELELMEDIKIRTGVNLHRLTIQKIDFLRDTAQIKIYYYET